MLPWPHVLGDYFRRSSNSGQRLDLDIRLDLLGANPGHSDILRHFHCLGLEVPGGLGRNLDGARRDDLPGLSICLERALLDLDLGKIRSSVVGCNNRACSVRNRQWITGAIITFWTPHF